MPATPFRLIAAAAVASAALALAMALSAGNAHAQRGDRTGKQIVDSLCVSCHGTGEKGAPRIGDRKAWAKLEKRGLTGLSKSALRGLGDMPHHGGNPDLSDTEIERAITYMVNQSGGSWHEPATRRTNVSERTGEHIVAMRCANCHLTGVDGAPKIGEKAEWIPRLNAGLAAVVRSAITGHGKMPPRGGLANLSDAEIRSAVIFMFTTPGGGGTLPAKTP